MMTANNAAETAQNAKRTATGLDSKYGEIGISAVVAALHYKGEAKGSVSAPVAPQPETKWYADLAA
jgi:hypothetical protein